MKQWAKGALIGGVLTVWGLYDVFAPGETPGTVGLILNYLSLIAGLFVLGGSYILYSRDKTV
jgi:hypothetical protein